MPPRALGAWWGLRRSLHGTSAPSPTWRRVVAIPGLAVGAGRAQASDVGDCSSIWGWGSSSSSLLCSSCCLWWPDVGRHRAVITREPHKLTPAQGPGDHREGLKSGAGRMQRLQRSGTSRSGVMGASEVGGHRISEVRGHRTSEVRGHRTSEVRGHQRSGDIGTSGVRDARVEVL